MSYRVVILGDNHEKDHQENDFDQNKKDARSSSHFIKWRLRGIAALRIIFGFLWAFDAWVKWQMLSTLSTIHFLQAANEQPPLIAAWIKLWLHVVYLNAHLFLTCIILGEVCIALCLIVGVFNKLACGAGMFLTLLLWSTAIGFVWLYVPSTTTTTAAVISFLASLGLWLANAGQTLSLQRYLPTPTKIWPLLTAQFTKEREQVPHALYMHPIYFLFRTPTKLSFLASLRCAERKYLLFRTPTKLSFLASLRRAERRNSQPAFTFSATQSTEIASSSHEAGRPGSHTTTCTQAEPTKGQRLLPM